MTQVVEKQVLAKVAAAQTEMWQFIEKIVNTDSGYDCPEGVAQVARMIGGVLEQRFGLSDGSGRTLEEVGKQFAVTRERIRQIEAKALRKLRHPTRIRKLGGFFGTA